MSAEPSDSAEMWAVWLITAYVDLFLRRHFDTTFFNFIEIDFWVSSHQLGVSPSHTYDVSGEFEFSPKYFFEIMVLTPMVQLRTSLLKGDVYALIPFSWRIQNPCIIKKPKMYSLCIFANKIVKNTAETAQPSLSHQLVFHNFTKCN